MREIINKFKGIFDNYDYQNHNITKLVLAVELLSQIMSLVDTNDQEYIKKISSFLSLVSSDIDKEILDIGMVEYIYATKIYPILDFLEYKYKNVTVKSSTEIVQDMLQDQYVLFETGGHMGYNKVEDKRMFGKIKEVGMNVEKIYKDIANQCMNKERGERALRDLKKTSKTMSLLSLHENVSILDISSSIGGISRILLDCISNNKFTTKLDELFSMGFERIKVLEFE
jgi:hypothetical protein